MNNQRHSTARGFTIIELLVATAITALLMTLMVTIITGVTKSWNSSSGKLTSGGQARLILDQITKDLQCAIFRSDGNTWLSARILSDTTTTGNSGTETWVSGTNTKPYANSTDLAATGSSVAASDKGSMAAARFGKAGAWLRFFTTQPGTNTGSNDNLSAPVAVGYRIMREPVTTNNSSTVRYMLYRGQVSPTNTFAAGYDLNDTTATHYPVPTAQPADGGTVASLYWPARKEVLAENVVDFGVRMYVKETTVAGGTVMRLIFPAAAQPVQGASPYSGAPYQMLSPVTASDAQTFHNSKSGATASATDYYANTFPDVIEIMVRVLTSDGVQKLELLENPPSGYTAPSNAPTWWEIVEANSTVYTRRIEINAKAF
ncbi:MAG: prepilin-type N-terminal cleavage/methylation domain-containing protein [Opitutaceae bacterium]|jgi:prepilin-type N-terminal cleavage/methylation domain-containing protein